MQNTTTNRKDNTKHMSVSNALANERIRAPQVRLVDDTGDNQVIPTRDALHKARSQGLDLVVINNQAQPWVVKILDLNKWLYEQKRAEKARLKKSRENEIVIKEVQMRPVTDDHDIQIKARMAQGFLDDNCKVKVVIKFRGREMAHRDLGEAVMHKFLEQVGEHRVERPPAHQGNTLSVILMPVK
jgi:translation initiation factor IF-3